MARQIVVVVALIFFSIIGMASASADAPSAFAEGSAEVDPNVIGTTDGITTDPAPVGGPVSEPVFPNLSPTESPKSGAIGLQVSSIASAVSASLAGFFYF